MVEAVILTAFAAVACARNPQPFCDTLPALQPAPLWLLVLVLACVVLLAGIALCTYKTWK